MTGFDVNYSLNAPMPGPGTNMPGSAMQISLAALMEAKHSGYCSLLERRANVSSGTSNTFNVPSEFRENFAVTIAGIGFIPQFSASDCTVRCTLEGGSRLIDNDTTTTKVDVEKGRYYFVPVSVAETNGQTKNAIGHWPTSPHQWFMANDGDTDNYYSYPIEQRVFGSSSITGSSTTANRVFTSFSGTSLLMLDLYGSIIRVS
jgi:hypothetical protein|tara:strand:+ start:1487 stop:2095 length:609 start_codon:yes stop_codon:yes gene_type:complete